MSVTIHVTKVEMENQVLILTATTPDENEPVKRLMLPVAAVGMRMVVYELTQPIQGVIALLREVVVHVLKLPPQGEGRRRLWGGQRTDITVTWATGIKTTATLAIDEFKDALREWYLENKDELDAKVEALKAEED